MKKAWIIVAIILTVAGAAIFVGALFATNFDFTKIPGGKEIEMEEKTYTLDQDFVDIDIRVKVTDVRFRLSEDGTTRVVVLESERIRHTVAVENNVLKISSVEDERKWYDFSFFRKTPSITIYLCRDEYNGLNIQNSTGDIEIPKEFTFERVEVETSTGDIEYGGMTRTALRLHTSTGDVTMEDFNAYDIEVIVKTGKITVRSGNPADFIVDPLSSLSNGQASFSVSTGALQIEDFHIGKLYTKGTTGSVRMKNVKTAGNMTIERSTGSIYFDGCDALSGKISIETSTGSVRGSFLTGKTFKAKSSTGHVRVPDTEGILCEIRTSTGDIDVTIEGIGTPDRS